MKPPLPGMAKYMYAPAGAALSDVLEITPPACAPDWILVCCEDDGSECLRLIDEIGIIRIEREKKEEEERLAAEAAAAAEEARLIAEEEKRLKQEAEGKNKKDKRGRGER
jgi:hypothetical protein